MNTYTEAISWIHSRLKHGINLGLARMEWLLEKMGNPEKELKVIHVAGTNGKGSTVTFLRSILNEAGYEVGTFTSPYIETFNERISINGNPVSDADLVKLVRIVKPLTEELEAGELGPPTEFEIITAMAMYYFANIRSVDFTILEVGLGGRFDSTNTVHPLMTIITNIGMDHINILGDTVEKIAFEKAGIIKEGVPLFTGAKQQEAHSVIRAEAEKKHAEVYQLGIDFSVENHESVPGGEKFTYLSRETQYENMKLSLLGRHQTENAAIAVASLMYMKENGLLKLSEKEIRAGLEKAYWPGRMEVLQQRPVVILDGAHNTEGLKAFAATMNNRYEGKNIKMIFAALEDKDLSHMLPLLKTMNAEVYFTQFDFPRAASASKLKEIGKMEDASVEEDWRALLRRMVNELDVEDVLAVTGSLYFISEAKQFLVNLLEEI
ncbi:bifunctional folylpolyglutamate synthase/dihydrofolate synthase [Siminovitchia acidinfaciens]|uniref:Dihydrofolate synthase/folylpolyglutamate synthase n=1 Tax=Siminovitchia acidinfaciens TaxID=2321395 RepID=A0A429Y4D4_9BACI|nr:folylpolyglutamate synthase/dihydrofolate synthase family protein [Siminovitchia acidinfaciens]RST76227.1 bifunctional folylpolyglutamate synthase/dihydrofolate synthase [Siminovitchia acidinfaciens]